MKDEIRAQARLCQQVTAFADTHQFLSFIFHPASFAGSAARFGALRFAMTPQQELPDASPAPALPGLGARAALAVIGFYQRFVSPGLPASCRFYPSCSRYTYDAIARFGLGRGALLGLGRVCRCHPWHPGGVDPVPDAPPHLRQSLARSISNLKLSARRRFASWRN